MLYRTVWCSVTSETVYTQACALVWRVVGMSHWTHEDGTEDGIEDDTEDGTDEGPQEI